MFRTRAISLTLIGLLHALLLVRTNSSGPMFISAVQQAPTIISGFILLFLSYVVFRTNDRMRGARILADLRSLSLGPALIFCLIFGFFLIIGIIRGARWALAEITGIPFIGRSPEGDENLVLLVSWFLISSVVLTWTSTKADGVQLAASTQRPPYFTVAGLSQEYEFVISQLADRALDLQKRSGYILISIVFMLICAALFIVFAGQITSLDVTGVKLVSLAQADVRSAEDELDRINSDITRKQESRRRAKEQAAKGDQRGDPPTSEDTPSDDEIAKLKFEAKKVALTKANEVLLKVKDKQFEDERSKDQTSGQTLLIQTSVTRFGVVLIMVFLVQILVSLYRYNMRLSAFYFGRADALVLAGKKSGDLRALVDVISPDTLDFGKPPRTPAQEAGGLLEAWAGRVRGRGGSSDKHGSGSKEKKSAGAEDRD